MSDLQCDIHTSDVLSVAPAIEPVTLNEAKAHLRVVHDEDNDYIEALITAAREHVELFTRRALISQTRVLRLDFFPATIELPRPPLISITSIQYVDANGVTQTMDAADYQVDTASEPGRVQAAYGTTWPSPRIQPNAVIVTYVAGYGAAASAVPERAKAVIKLLISHWYDQRAPVITGTNSSELPLAAETLLWGLRATL